MIGGIIYSLFKINLSRQNLFKEVDEFKIKDYIVLISLFGLIGIICSYPSFITEYVIIGLRDIGILLSGIFGGVLIGFIVGGFIGIYNMLICNYQIIPIVIVNSLILGTFAGFFRVKFLLDRKLNYKNVIFKKLLPVGILYLSLVLNGIYQFNVNEISVVIATLILNLASVFAIIFATDKLCQFKVVREIKNKNIKNLNKSLQRLDSFSQLTQEVVDSSTNLYQILDSIVDMTCEILEVDAGGIIILENDKEQISYKTANNIDQDLIPAKINATISETIIEDQEPIINNNLELNQEFGFIKEAGYDTLLAVPLIECDDKIGEIYGILFVANRIEFYQQELQVMDTLATQAVYLIKGDKLFERMQRNVAELSTLQMISTTINSTLDLDQVLELAIDVIVGTMGVSSCAVLLFDESTEELSLEASRNWPDKLDKKEIFNMKGSIFDEIIEAQKTIVFNEVPDSVKDKLNFSEMESVIAVPLKLREEVIGIITAINTVISHNFNNDDERFLTTLANQVAVAIENARIYNQMEERAIKDGLTQLYNHSYFQRTLSEEIARAERFQNVLSVLLLDIDDFKDVNDAYGHPVGDRVLKKLSNVLKEITREIDIVARYGGEEFAIILPETGLKGAKLLGNRLNEKVREMVIKEDGLEIKITVSIGAAAYSEGLAQEDLINNADRALYRAKAKGKDKTCIFKH